ncbi:hypothetical protein Tco_0150643 [Tanacetum coccineum]
MIIYSFNDEEEYLAVKEDEYDDLTIASEEACRAYQEIFRMMDEGWMDEWEVDRYGNANLVIMEYLVNISKRRAFWSLNEDILKINDSDNQYAVSIKEDTAYPCLHSPKTTKETSSIRRIQRSSIRRIQDISFEECYKALSEKLDWENPEGGDYPFDLTKPLPLVMSRNRQKVHVDYFFNNDLKYLQGGTSTMTYMTSLTKTKATQYDLQGIEDMVPNIWVPVKVAFNKNMHYEEILTLERTTLRTSLDDITKNIRMEYLPKRRWSTLEKEGANITIKAIDKQLKERRLIRSLEKFIGGRHYGTDLRLLQTKQFDDLSSCVRSNISEIKGKVPTEMELVLEQTQQGTSYEVSVSAEGVEELKRKVKIKGEKKEALLTLRQKPGQYICCQESQR